VTVVNYLPMNVGALLHKQRSSDVLVSQCPKDLTSAGAVCRNGRTPQELTRLSVITIELLLICVQYQFRIPVVTQISGVDC